MALDIRIAGRYRLGRKIGSGSFGDIYLGKREGILSRPQPSPSELRRAGVWQSLSALEMSSL